MATSQASPAAAPPQQIATASPFFHQPHQTSVGALAVLHLKRDSLVPIILQGTANDGYAEGAVTNTRFGSFPHSTLTQLPWGSQVRASKVDTGTRGRKMQKEAAAASVEPTVAVGSDAQPDQPKRKRDDQDEGRATVDPVGDSKRHKSQHVDHPENSTTETKQNKTAIQAGSGFLHILPPTPECWTSSLDHRTQVVYIPDYSYILQRLRVRPGSRLIEAGAGSGSFTHAAARAVFSGYPSSNHTTGNGKSTGSIYSYEYHAPRMETLSRELSLHGLDGVVTLTQRDVCNDGFMLQDGSSPQADAIFLDLPAPWLALEHLTRSLASSTSPSPLAPSAPVQICTFSPCIEQVQATMSAMRRLGWVDAEMVEVAQRRIDVRRERVGLKEEGLRGVNAVAASVEEAIERQRDVERKLEVFHESKKARKQQDRGQNSDNGNDDGNGQDSKNNININLNLNNAEPITAGNADRQQGDARVKVTSKQERLARIKEEVADRKLYREGNLVHRTEPDVKSHTSYLVFATLPRAWTAADETAALATWPVDDSSVKTAVNAAGKDDDTGGAQNTKRPKKGKINVS